MFEYLGKKVSKEFLLDKGFRIPDQDFEDLELPGADNFDLGLSIAVDKRFVLRQIIYFTEQSNRSRHEQFKTYLGDLPFGLDFSDSMQDVERKLGAHTAYSPAKTIALIGQTPQWYEFQKDGMRAVVSFNERMEILRFFISMNN